MWRWGGDFLCEGGGCVRGAPLLEAIVGSSRESIIIRMTNPPIAMMIIALHQMSTCQTGGYSSGINVTYIWGCMLSRVAGVLVDGGRVGESVGGLGMYVRVGGGRFVFGRDWGRTGKDTVDTVPSVSLRLI